jgi:hypothetical protein
MEDNTNPFDSSEIYHAIRNRHHSLQDRVRKLMGQEGHLEEEIVKDQESCKKLKEAILSVQKVGLDAGEMQKMLASTSEKIDRDSADLATITDELALVREAMKWAEMAHDALHWGRFADQTLARFDRLKAESSAALATLA